VSASGSISFDRASSFYDATRTLDDASTERVVDLLVARVAVGGRVLEAGIGTGQVGLPLARRGVDLVGFDLSAGMMAELGRKAGGQPIPLVQADATRMPFADRSFSGAYCRWVLHLIPAWIDAIAEMDRVVVPTGAIAIEPGGESGVFADVYLKFVEILGEAARLPGLDLIDREALLDDAMETIGRGLSEVVEVTYDRKVSIAEELERAPMKVYAWTWPVPDDELRDAADQVHRWAEARFDVEAPQPEVPTRWRIYTRAA
jgi:SAM-dependent methyltransferase